MKNTLMLSLLLAGFSVVVFTSARADVNSEHLVQPVPPGYKPGPKIAETWTNTQEFMLQNETPRNWTELVVTQTYLHYGKKPITTAELLDGIATQWTQDCKDVTMGSYIPGEPANIHSDKANGYDVSMVFLRCPLNQQTGKPENTLFRAIKGNDNMYVVQKAFKFEPTPDQIAQAVQYLSSVNVCDASTADHPCTPSAQ